MKVSELIKMLQDEDQDVVELCSRQCDLGISTY